MTLQERWSRANTPGEGGGALTYYFSKISKKLHEMEKILGRGGVGGGHYTRGVTTLFQISKSCISVADSSFTILFTVPRPHPHLCVSTTASSLS